MTNNEEFENITKEYELAFKKYHDCLNELFKLESDEEWLAVHTTEEQLKRLDEFEMELGEIHQRWIRVANEVIKSRQRKT